VFGKKSDEEKIDEYGDNLLTSFESGDYRESLKWLDKLLEIQPNDETVLGNKGVALCKLEEYEESLKWLDKALHVKPDYLFALFYKAEALRQLEKTSDSISTLDQILEIDPQYPQAEFLKQSIINKSNSVVPPDSWKIIPEDSQLTLEGNWKFPLNAVSEEPFEIYVYEIDGFPELVKIGISKDSEDRQEKYYGQLIWKKKLDRRTAGLVECLFMHSTYHRAHNALPRLNVETISSENILPELKVFFDSVGKDSAGLTEVRVMTTTEAICTIGYIVDILTTNDLFDAVSTFGIRTWDEQGFTGRSTVTLEKGTTWN
jgi:tetratricopeptide (TPR) repeat protein